MKMTPMSARPNFLAPITFSPSPGGRT
jgi:hypothetical protein